MRPGGRAAGAGVGPRWWRGGGAALVARGFVHGKTDDYCSPELAQALYERKPGEKEIRWLDASQHIDFYDSQAHVTAAAQAAAGFLHHTLG